MTPTAKTRRKPLTKRAKITKTRTVRSKSGPRRQSAKARDMRGKASAT